MKPEMKKFQICWTFKYSIHMDSMKGFLYPHFPNEETLREVN